MYTYSYSSTYTYTYIYIYLHIYCRCNAADDDNDVSRICVISWICMLCHMYMPHLCRWLLLTSGILSHLNLYSSNFKEAFDYPAYPWKMVVGIRSCPFESRPVVRRRTINFREGNCFRLDMAAMAGLFTSLPSGGIFQLGKFFWCSFPQNGHCLGLNGYPQVSASKRGKTE